MRWVHTILSAAVFKCFRVLSCTKVYYLQIRMLWLCFYFYLLYLLHLSYCSNKDFLRNMLTRRAENEHSCLVPGSNKNALSFSPFTNMLAVRLLYIISIYMNDISPVVPRFSSTFLMKIFRLCQRPFLHLKKWSCWFLSWIYLYSALHLLIYVCWTFSISLKWGQLGHGG